jgi:hypothetical protein
MTSDYSSDGTFGDMIGSSVMFPPYDDIGPRVVGSDDEQVDLGNMSDVD